ncbi:hypothetical protein Emed_002906 [Eimeria media]
MTSSKPSRRSSGNSSSKGSAIPPTKVSGSSSKSSSSSSNSSSSSSAPAASSHRSSSKKHQKDPAAPKRPLSAYMLFAKEKRAEVLQQQPELRSQVKEVAKAIGELWRAADAAEKQHFAAAAAKEKAKYGQALAAYKQHK